MIYSEFRRVVVTPYWCHGSPLAWKCPDADIGIAHFAHEGKVGMFNLAWWLLQSATPPKTEQAYRNAHLGWPILVAPRVWIDGASLCDHAGFKSQEQFSQFLMLHKHLRGSLEYQGVTWKLLMSLANHANAA